MKVILSIPTMILGRQDRSRYKLLTTLNFSPGIFISVRMCAANLIETSCTRGRNFTRQTSEKAETHLDGGDSASCSWRLPGCRIRTVEWLGAAFEMYAIGSLNFHPAQASSGVKSTVATLGSRSCHCGRDPTGEEKFNHVDK